MAAEARGAEDGDAGAASLCAGGPALSAALLRGQLPPGLAALEEREPEGEEGRTVGERIWERRRANRESGRPEEENLEDLLLEAGEEEEEEDEEEEEEEEEDEEEEEEREEASSDEG